MRVPLPYANSFASEEMGHNNGSQMPVSDWEGLQILKEMLDLARDMYDV